MVTKILRTMIMFQCENSCGNIFAHGLPVHSLVAHLLSTWIFTHSFLTCQIVQSTFTVLLYFFPGLVINYSYMRKHYSGHTDKTLFTFPLQQRMRKRTKREERVE
jgi:hypothetical protein